MSNGDELAMLRERATMWKKSQNQVSKRWRRWSIKTSTAFCWRAANILQSSFQQCHPPLDHLPTQLNPCLRTQPFFVCLALCQLHAHLCQLFECCTLLQKCLIVWSPGFIWPEDDFLFYCKFSCNSWLHELRGFPSHCCVQLERCRIIPNQCILPWGHLITAFVSLGKHSWLQSIMITIGDQRGLGPLFHPCTALMGLKFTR